MALTYQPTIGMAHLGVIRSYVRSRAPCRAALRLTAICISSTTATYGTGPVCCAVLFGAPRFGKRSQMVFDYFLMHREAIDRSTDRSDCGCCDKRQQRKSRRKRRALVDKRSDRSIARSNRNCFWGKDFLPSSPHRRVPGKDSIPGEGFSSHKQQSTPCVAMPSLLPSTASLNTDGVLIFIFLSGIQRGAEGLGGANRNGVW